MREMKFKAMLDVNAMFEKFKEDEHEEGREEGGEGEGGEGEGTTTATMATEAMFFTETVAAFDT